MDSRESEDPNVLAEAVFNGGQIDWDREIANAAGNPARLQRIRSLQHLARVDHVHREVHSGDGGDLPFREWRHLKILARIGSGTHGELFRARDESLGREVALKLYHELPDRPGHQEQVIAEARRLARIRHENVVRIHGVDVDRGRVGFWMELLEGESLDRILERDGPLEAHRVITIGIAVCRALHAAHGAGVLHGDIKPGNVFCERGGNVCLVDFGSGRPTAPRGPGDLRRSGTPLFMAPETLLEGRLTERSDVYSLGALLFNAMTCHHPIEADDLDALAAAHVEREGQPDRARSGSVRFAEVGARPDVPEPLANLVLRMLRKNPEDRFASMAEVERELQRIQADLFGPKPRARKWGGAVLAGTMLLAGIAAVVAFVRSAPRDGYATVAALGSPRQLTFSGGASIPVWSPDGRFIAFRQGNGSYVIPAEGGNPRRLDPEPGMQIKLGNPWAWSPDSRRLLLHARVGEQTWPSIVAFDIETGAVEVLANRGIFPSMSHSALRLAYAIPDSGIWIRPLPSGPRRQLVAPDRPGTAVYKPLWSPDDRWITYMRWGGRSPGHEVWLVRPDGSEKHHIPTEGIEVAGHGSFTPDGKSIVVTGESQGVASVWRISLLGDPHVRLTPGSLDQVHASLAPDGIRFAYGSERDISHVIVIDRRSGEIARDVQLSSATSSPFYGSQGRRLFFTCLMQGHWQVWKVAADAAEGAIPLVNEPGASCLAVAPGENSTLLELRANVGHVHRFGDILWTQRIWRADSLGGHGIPITPDSQVVADLSPSGEQDGHILYSVFDHGQEKLLMREPDGSTSLVYDPGRYCGFLAFDLGPSDGTVLLATVGPGAVPGIEMLEIASGKRTPYLMAADLAEGLAIGAPLQVAGLAISQDRQCLAVAAASGDDSWVLAYDSATRQRTLARPIERCSRAASVAWNGSGEALAVEVRSTQADVFVWEPATQPR